MAARNATDIEMEMLGNPLALLSRSAFSSASRRAAACDEHRAIVEAIRARDPERAEHAAHAHMRAAQSVRMEILGSGADNDRRTP